MESTWTDGTKSNSIQTCNYMNTEGMRDVFDTILGVSGSYTSGLHNARLWAHGAIGMALVVAPRQGRPE
jgi:hypothetical protein